MLRLPLTIRLLLAVGLFYGLAFALVRPMLQISDEVAYLGVAQQSALDRLPESSPDRSRVAPDEAPLFLVGTWKPLYGWVAGTLLLAFGGLDDPALAAVWLRVIFCLSIPVSILATFLLARHVAPSNPLVLVGAPALVAFHPVFVSYGAGVTPDALANPAAMFAVLLTVRFADGTSVRWEPLLLMATAAVAIALKDTTYFFVPLVPMAWLLRWHVRLTEEGCVEGRDASPRRPWHRASVRDPWLILLPAAGLLVIVAALTQPAFARALSSPYWSLVRAPDDVVSRLLVIAAEVVTEWWTQLPSYASSFWGSLGNFGGTIVEIPRALRSFWYTVTLAAIGGLLYRSLRSADHDDPQARAVRHARVGVLVLGVLLVSLLAPVRQALLGSTDLFQGRWLFPMLGAIAVGITTGLSAFVPQPWRLLPLFTLGIVTSALVAMLFVVIPYYYTDFPFALRHEALFLQGTFARGADPERLGAFVTAAHQARSVSLMLAALAGFCVSTAVWGYVVWRKPHP